jgi:hypothetical protein
VAIATANAPNGLTSGTQITATFSGAVTLGDMAAASFSGIAATSPVDVGATSTQSGVAGWTATVTTTNPNDLLLGLSEIDAVTSSTAIAPNLQLHNFNQASFKSSVTSEYQIDNSIGSPVVNGTWASASGATANATVVVAYKAG